MCKCANVSDFKCPASKRYKMLVLLYVYHALEFIS